MIRMAYDMAERSSALESTRLLLEILKRIPKGKKVTASNLHDALRECGLQRSKRTIERALDMLTEHFDIECDTSGKPYGYCWKSNAKGLSLPTLNEQESLLLTLAQRYLKNLLPQQLMASMDSFFEQARKNLLVPADVATGAKPERGWLIKVRVVEATQPLLPPQIQEGVLEAVSKALYENKWLTVDYRNAANEGGEYQVMPLGLVQQGPCLYLVCRYKGYDNERNLAVHRIIKAEVSGVPFERPVAFDLEKYDQDGRFGFGEGKRVVLSFNIDRGAGRHLLETPLSEDQQVEVHDHSYTIKATVIDADRLDWWLRGFGAKVRNVSKVPLP